MTEARGKEPNKLTPWVMAPGQGSLKKGMKKLGGARGLGWHKSGDGGQSSRTEQDDMDIGTSEQSLGLSSHQTHTKEGGSSDPQERVAPAEKSKVGPGSEDWQGKTESLGPTPGRVTGGHLQFSPEPPKRPKSPFVRPQT